MFIYLFFSSIYNILSSIYYKYVYYVVYYTRVYENIFRDTYFYTYQKWYYFFPKSLLLQYRIHNRIYHRLPFASTTLVRLNMYNIEKQSLS